MYSHEFLVVLLVQSVFKYVYSFLIHLSLPESLSSKISPGGFGPCEPPPDELHILLPFHFYRKEKRYLEGGFFSLAGTYPHSLIHRGDEYPAIGGKLDCGQSKISDFNCI